MNDFEEPNPPSPWSRAGDVAAGEMDVAGRPATTQSDPVLDVVQADAPTRSPGERPGQRVRHVAVVAAAVVVLVVVGARGSIGGGSDGPSPSVVAERFLAALGSGDLETAGSMLADQVTFTPLPGTGDWSSMLSRGEAVLALEAEQVYGVSYDQVACRDDHDGRIVCAGQRNSRLRQIDQLAPVASSVELRVEGELVSGFTLAYQHVAFDPGGTTPLDVQNFFRWLDVAHPGVFPTCCGQQPHPSEAPRLFALGGQEWTFMWSRPGNDQLAAYLDEYEQLRTLGRTTDPAIGLSALIAGHRGGASVLIRHDGETTVVTAGAADDAGRPISPSTAFRVASLTKTFVATAVFQLVDEGLVDLDAALSTYLPGVVIGGDASVRDLLTHRTGLPDYAALPEFVADTHDDRSRWFTPAEVLDYVAAAPSAPNQRGYSNTNYVLLGLLLERLDGTDLAASLDRRILAPLGLSSTRLATRDQPGSPELAGGWSPEGSDVELSGSVRAPSASIVSGAWAAGGLISTPGDLATFLDALLDQQLISTQSLREMFTTQNGVGSGIFDMNLGSWERHGLGNSGWIDGYRSQFVFAPTTRDLVIVLVNDETIDPDDVVFWATSIA